MEDGRLDNELTFEDILKIFRKRFWWFFLNLVDYFKERSDNPENVTKNGVI